MSRKPTAKGYSPMKKSPGPGGKHFDAMAGGSLRPFAKEPPKKQMADPAEASSGGEFPLPKQPWQQKPRVTPKNYSAPQGTSFSIAEGITGMEVQRDPAIPFARSDMEKVDGLAHIEMLMLPTKNFAVDVDPYGSGSNTNPAGQPWASVEGTGGFPQNPGGILNVGKAKNFGLVRAYVGTAGNETSPGVKVYNKMVDNGPEVKSGAKKFSNEAD